MNPRMIAAVFAALAVVAAPALADWDPGDPYKMHYPQLPDLTSRGLDVLAGPRPIQTPGAALTEKFLADDWLCTASGPVADIHIWGSYNEDQLLLTDPGRTLFSLVIFDNVPAGPGANFSHPGVPLWSAYVRPEKARIYANANERFYDPNTDQIIGIDTQVWQFNFRFPEATAFQQKRGDIYWLGVHHTLDLDENGAVDVMDLSRLVSVFPAAFGWKTSGVQQFMDDAVWADVVTLNADPHVVPQIVDWHPLVYPGTTESLDLAFVITPEPSCLVLVLLAAVGVITARRIR